MRSACALLVACAAGFVLSAEPLLAQASVPLSESDLLAATRQARDARDFARAEQLAREGMARSGDPVWPLTLALVLADAGRSSEALAVLDAPWPGGLPRNERLLAEGYAHLLADDTWPALTAYGEVLRVEPGNAEAREAVASLLDRLRAPYAATAVGGANPSREADEAAALVRWGPTLAPTEPSLRFAGTDRALARLDALIAQANGAGQVDDALLRRLRLDRLIALRDRVRMAEVISEAAALSAAGPLPAYATHALADALLYERRPEEALAAYEAVIAADPRNLQAQYGRFFALIECERLAEAVEAVDAIAARQPPFRSYAGGTATSPNWEFAYATSLAAESRLWSNDVAGGYARLVGLAGAAPANAGFQRSLVSAMRARGWPRAAESQAAIATSLDPESLETRIMLGETALSRNRLGAARGAAEALLALAPENRAVQRFSDEVAAARGWALEAEFAPKWNEGGGANASGEEWAFATRIETPRLADTVGLFALSDGHAAHPPEGKATRYRAGGGIAVHGVDISATAFATTSWGSLSRGGVGGTIDWQANDRLSIGIAGETFSSETPLRAVLQGITADSLSASLAWRRDERTAVWLGGGLLSYSDGNDRLSASLSGQHMVLVGPHLDVTARAGLWYSENSRPGGPYFAPDSELSGSGGLTLEHIAWRRYENVFTHALHADLGFQDQKGFQADWTGALRYEQRWRHDPWWEIHWSVLLDRRVYDGEPEKGFGLVLGFRRRFR